MTASEKQLWQYSIVCRDPDYVWYFSQDYFELSWDRTARLATYAELFGIRSTPEMTKARKLWYRCQQVYKQLPF